MLLAIDIGNTNIVIGLFEKRELRHRWRLGSDPQRTADEFGVLVRELCAQSGVSMGRVLGVVVCSVVPAMTEAFRAMSRDVFGIEPVVVGPDTDLGIVIDYRDPTEVGPDRLVNAVGVRELTSGAAIVVDFGTATTFDVVSADGHYLGGAIAPGLMTSSETLFRKAALLHRIALTPPAAAIGRTTEEALRSGILFGAAGQVDALVTRIVEEWGERPMVVATGGLASTVAALARTIDRVDPDLTLKGLALIHERASR